MLVHDLTESDRAKDTNFCIGGSKGTLAPISAIFSQEIGQKFLEPSLFVWRMPIIFSLKKENENAQIKAQLSLYTVTFFRFIAKNGPKILVKGSNFKIFLMHSVFFQDPRFWLRMGG